MNNGDNKPKIVIGATSPLQRFSVRELANELNLSEGHMYRSMRGLPVGSDFIAQCLVKFPNRTFADLFDVQIRPGVVLQRTPPPTVFGSPLPFVADEIQHRTSETISPVSYAEAVDAGLGTFVRGSFDEILQEQSPDCIVIYDNSEPAYDLMADGSIYLHQNAIASRKVAYLMTQLHINEGDLTLGNTIPAYLARGERNNKAEEVG